MTCNEGGVGSRDGGAEQRREAAEHIRGRLLCQREKKGKKNKKESPHYSVHFP